MTPNLICYSMQCVVKSKQMCCYTKQIVHKKKINSKTISLGYSNKADFNAKIILRKNKHYLSINNENIN